MLFVEYAKCGTCRKAKKWLDAHGFEYEDRPIKEENPTEEELREEPPEVFEITEENLKQ